MLAALLQQAIELSTAVYETTQHVGLARQDCENLGRGVRAISHVLQDAQDVLLSLAPQKVEPPLQVLLDALTVAQEVLPEFKASSCLCAVVHAGDLKGKLQNVGTMLGAALGMLPFAELSSVEHVQEQVEKLSKELHNIKFTMLDALQRLSSRLEYLMQYDEGKLVQLIMHILSCFDKNQELSVQQRVESEVLELKDYLVQGKAQDPQKEQYIHCFLALLNMHQHLCNQPNSKDPQHWLLDPVSLELMQDPVVLLESGITYDRSSLEDWLAKKGLQALLTGELVDPMTGKLLTKCPPDMVPNKEVLEAVRKWQESHNEPSDYCLTSRSTSSVSTGIFSVSDLQQVVLDPTTFEQEMVEADLPELEELLSIKCNLKLPRDTLSKLATALREEESKLSPTISYSKVIEIVDTAQMLFTAADWRGSSCLELDIAYQVFKECGFGYVSVSQFREFCAFQHSSKSLRSLDLEHVLIVVGDAVFGLWQRFHHMSGGSDTVDAKQLHHALSSCKALSRVSLADCKNMVKYHSRQGHGVLKFHEFWELHNCVVALLTSFRNEDRAYSGYMKEDQALRVLLQAGLVNLTQLSLRDAWRKVASRQLQLSCSSVLGMFYHLLNHDMKASEHVRSYHGVGKSRSNADTAAAVSKQPWQFETFWNSLTADRILRGRYQVFELGKLDQKRGSCLAYDCRTCTNVQITFFFCNMTFAEEMEVMQLVQPSHVLDVIEHWEAVEDGGVPLPAALVTPVFATLESWLAQQRLKPSPLSERKELLGQVLEALSDLEQAGRVHLSLSPANIVFSWDPEIREPCWKLAGLGDCVVLGQEGRVSTPLACTAPEFAECCSVLGHPEQSTSSNLVGVDGCGPHMWSFGVITLQVLTGAQFFKDAVPSPLLLKNLTQQLLPTQVHRNHLANIVGPTELKLLDYMLVVSPYYRRAAHSLLRDFFPHRFPAPEMDLVDRSPRPVVKPGVPATPRPGSSSLGMFWHSAAQWAMQPSPTIKQQMKQAQDQIKAYSAEILFQSTGAVPFPWPSNPIRMSSSSLSSPSSPLSPALSHRTQPATPTPLPKERSTVDITSFAFKADQVWSAMLRTSFSRASAPSTSLAMPTMNNSAAPARQTVETQRLSGKVELPVTAEETNTGNDDLDSLYCGPKNGSAPGQLMSEQLSGKEFSQGRGDTSDTYNGSKNGMTPRQLTGDKVCHRLGEVNNFTTKGADAGSDVEGFRDQVKA